MSEAIRPIALITGASAGIGRELARLFAADAYDLVLLARRREPLQQLAEELRLAHGTTSHLLVKDLSLAQATQEVFETLEQQRIAIDALVNNAGFGASGPFALSDALQQVAMVQVNAAALIHLTRLFLPGMIERRRGHVLNVASIAAYQPGPYMSVYYATKALVLSFSQAISHELRGSGVSVTALCPGPTRSEFFDRAGMRLPAFFAAHMMDASTVARIGYKGMKKGRRVVVPGFFNRLAVFLVRFTPSRLATAIAGFANKTRS
jgi:hypothetical protein